MRGGKRVGYVRVSTVDQNTERQLDGVQLDKVFTDKASGKDTERPQLQAALVYLREGDTLIVHSMDRLARNTEDLLRLVRELTAKDVVIEFVKERLTFSGDVADAMSQLLLGVLASFAQFERTLLRERQREGIAIAKAKGVYTGRKRFVTPAMAQRAAERVANGEPKARIARDLGISRDTLYKHLRAVE